jgi:hypothetical protein
MKKIYDAFDNIKIDDKLKEVAYQKLKQRKTKKVYVNKFMQYGALTFAFATIFIIVLVTDNQSEYPNDLSVRVDSFTVFESTNDKFLYGGHTYYLVNDADASLFKLGKKIGTLKKINTTEKLKNDFDSYENDGAFVYSCEDITISTVRANEDNMVLIVETNNKMLVYRRIVQ